MVSPNPFLPLMSPPHRLLSAPPPAVVLGVDQNPHATDATASIPSPPPPATIISVASPCLHGYNGAIGQRRASIASNQCSNMQRKLDCGNEFFHLTVSTPPRLQSASIVSDDSLRKSVVAEVKHDILYSRTLAMGNQNFNVPSSDSCVNPLFGQSINSKALAMANRSESSFSDDPLRKSRTTEISQDMNSGILVMSKKSINVSSASDEEPLPQQQQQPTDIDDKKQKRMLSNRESARRSRLRKQQHLDELRSQVAHLKAENSLLLNKFNMATQQYTQLTSENCVLRSHAIDLSHQLQRLRHVALAHRHAGGQSFNIEAAFPDPLTVTSSYSTIYSQTHF